MKSIYFESRHLHQIMEYEDLVRYKEEMKTTQKQMIAKIMAFGEKHGLDKWKNAKLQNP